MMNDTIYQRIFNELEKYLPSGWDRVVAYFEFGEASYSFSFYVKEGKSYIKCYDVPDIKDDELYKSFHIIEEMLSDERKNEKESWTSMTMIVGRDGKMHTEFDYSDLSKGTYQHKKNWKKKYLV